MSTKLFGDDLSKHLKDMCEAKKAGQQMQKPYYSSSRAVHLELAFGLDTDAFLNAFYRMVNRRGLPQEVVSDNGGYFVGAEKELRELAKNLDEDKIQRSVANKGIKWHFNPPSNPSLRESTRSHD